MSGQPSGFPLRGFRLQNGSGSGKDTGRALVGDFLFGFQPVLNIATAKLGAIEAKCFAANQCDGLRFVAISASRAASCSPRSIASKIAAALLVSFSYFADKKAAQEQRSASPQD